MTDPKLECPKNIFRHDTNDVLLVEVHVILDDFNDRFL
jgi:hypothetical protein